MAQPSGLEWNGILQVLAALPQGGEGLCANAAWGAVNGHGAKASTLGTNGQPTLSTLGALNAKNGTVGLGLDLVCNQLAGTTGLEAQLALRTYCGLP